MPLLSAFSRMQHPSLLESIGHSCHLGHAALTGCCLVGQEWLALTALGLACDQHRAGTQEVLGKWLE